MSAQDRQKRLQKAVESLLEDERLRSNLTDAEAKILLSWGEAQLTEAAKTPPRAASDVAAPDAISACLQQVRAALREINDLAGEKDRLSYTQMQQRLTALLSSQGKLSPTLSGRVDELAVQRGRLSNKEFVTRITELLSFAQREEDAKPSAKTAGGKKTPPAGPRRSSIFSSRLFVAAGVLVVLLLCLLVAVIFVYWRSLQSIPGATAIPPPTPKGATATATKPAAATWYQLYFTAPKYPDKPADHKGGLDEELTAFINTAQTSLDMAIYQLDLKNVTQALLNARKRGCTVRLVADVDILNDPQENPSLKQLQAAGITIVAGNSDAIMHNKYVVVDGKAVWTGSWNFTENDTYRYNNNAILIQSPELARNYTITFEKMWRERKFGSSRRPGGTAFRLTIGGATVESYFAPEDKVADKLIARLKMAQRSIDFMAFSFTHDAMGEAIRARAKAGVKVRGVFETTGSETQYSEYGRMREAKLDVLQDGNPYLMHHKVFIIDGKTVITGSFNFSKSADEDNDENLLIIDSAELAAQFTTEFERVYALAKNPPKR